jgi:hypothetical protein
VPSEGATEDAGSSRSCDPLSTSSAAETSGSDADEDDFDDSFAIMRPSVAVGTIAEDIVAVYVIDGIAGGEKLLSGYSFR